MKVNAPEKIYIEVTSDGTRYYRDVVKEERTEDTDIEYIRADVFIEKAERYIDTIEVTKVDLDEEIKSYFKGFGKFASVGIDDCIDIARHFFELGMKMAQKGEECEKIIAYIDKLLEKYPKNYYLLMVAEFIDSLQKKNL